MFRGRVDGGQVGVGAGGRRTEGAGLAVGRLGRGAGGQAVIGRAAMGWAWSVRAGPSVPNCIGFGR